MNNNFKIFLKEFLGYGLLVIATIELLVVLLLAAINRLGYSGSAGWYVFFLWIIAVLYFFAKRLGLNSRRAIFYRTIFWLYMVYAIAFSNIALGLARTALRGGGIVGLDFAGAIFWIFNPFVIIIAAFIPFLVILPKRKPTADSD